MLAGVDPGVRRNGPDCAQVGQPALQGGDVWESLPRMDPLCTDR